MTMRDIQTTDDNGFVPDNNTGTVFIRIAVPELKNQKCLQFQLDETVWQAKQRILAAFAKDLRDALNYGLYMPPVNGRAGKFLDEERLLKEYPLQGPIGFLEFKYKRRVYKIMQMNPRKLKQLHCKTNLKHFLEFVRNGNLEKMNKMTNKGLDPNFHDQDNGETPLTVAATLGKDKAREVLILLVSGGAHIDFRNRSGLTAMHRAAIVGNAEAIKALLDLGSSPDFKDGRGLTPLYYSVSNDTNQACTEMLLHERAFVGTHDDQGWCEIHQACRYGRVQHLEHLLFYGAEIDVQNASGNTPLHVCAAYSQDACARVLLFRGADRSILNYSNQTAYQVAVIANTMELADLINNHRHQDAVPIRELPNYSDRRKNSATPSMRSLLRSRSDPRLHASVLREQMLQDGGGGCGGGGSVSHHNLTALSDFYDTGSAYNVSQTASYASSRDYASSSRDYNSDSPCSLSVSSASSGPPQAGATSTLPTLRVPCWSYSRPPEPRPALILERSLVCTQSFLPPQHHPAFLRLCRGQLVTVLGVTDHGYLEGRTADGREGCFPASHVGELHLRKAESLGDLMTGDLVTMHRNTLAALVTTEKENAPRMAVLHKSPEGYGFVLRGAKSHTHVGNLNFTPSPEFPALQYLDSVDPASQAEKAGLRTGDFILEINGECVTRASHERVVQLIRASGNVLAMKVVSVKGADSQHTHPAAHQDWFRQHNSHNAGGAKTLPARGRKQAPLPPRRDPHTSLSYSKATAKSMAEGLAEIEQLDQTIAEFEQQSSLRRHSMHNIETASQSSEGKVASVRAAHAMKRMSVGEIVERSPAPPPPVMAKPLTGDPSSGAVPKMSPSEMKIKKYHKKASTSSSMERSKSTPDLADIEFGADGEEMVMRQASEAAQNKAPATWSKATVNSAAFVSDIVNKDGDRPDVPIRAPMPKRRAPDPPSKGEVVKINTTSGSQNTIYANVSEQIAQRRASAYESSFRPGTSAQLTDDPSVTIQSLEQAKLQHKKSASPGSAELIPHYSKPSLVSFAEDRVYETAQQFIKKHPNAMLLVTADIHGGETPNEPARPPVDRQFYEPEPDYEDSGDEEEDGHRSTSSSTTVLSLAPHDPCFSSSRSNLSANDPSSMASFSVHCEGAGPAVSLMAHSKAGGAVQGPPVLEKTSAAPPPPMSKSGSPNSGSPDWGSPQKGSPMLSSGSPHSNRVNSSVGSSRRSSVLSTASSGHDSVSKAINPPQQLGSETDHRVSHNPPPTVPPPPPPPPPPSHPPPSHSQAPPPPPLPSNHPRMCAVMSEQASVSKSASDPTSTGSGSIPASDILAAVAQRRARMENVGPRLTERQSSAPTITSPVCVSATQRNQEALRMAIAQRRSKLEQSNNKQVVEDIEARLNKNRKLQAVKHFSGKEKEGDAEAGKNTSLMAAKEDVLQSSGPAGDKADSKLPAGTKPESDEATKSAPSKPVVEPSKKPKEIMMHKAPPAKPSVPPPVNKAVSHAPGDKVMKKTDSAPALPSSKRSNSSKASALSAVPSTQSPIPKAGTVKSSDFIAMAEQARRDYLQKMSSPESRKKTGAGVMGVVQESQVMPVSKAGSETGSKPLPGVIQVQPAEQGSGEAVKVSIRDRISNFEKVKDKQSNGHSEPLFANGTLKHGNGAHGTQPGSHIDIIPPPPTFAADSGGASGHNDLIVSPPPPPPGFDDARTKDRAYDKMDDNFIPPPAQFSTDSSQDSGSGTTERCFQRKGLGQWQCGDVLDWLDSLDMGHYKPSFARSKVDGQRLQTLERNDYIQLGVTQVGHRMDLQRSIKRLMLRNNANS